MNRSATPVEPQIVPDSSRWSATGNRFQEAVVWEELESRPSIENIASFAPSGYEAGYAYPLVVWLHADNADEDCLPTVMRHVSTQNYVAVAPSLRGSEGYEPSSAWVQTPETISAAQNAVADAIHSASELFNINPNRVFLLGHGSGGTMALRLALMQPEAFAGVATFDGPMPTNHSPLSHLKAARKLPILFNVARESTNYPQPELSQTLSLLHTAGMKMDLRLHPGDDDLTTAMLADSNRWMMELITGSVSVEQQV